MKKPLTAGERLAPSARATPPSPPPPNPPRGRAPRDRAARVRKTKKRRFSVLGWLFSLMLTLATVAVAGVGVAGYAMYTHYSASLPDVQGLRNYQPHVMSRVYAGDSRLIAELATERRIFVPYSAIPEIVKRAFISAEDQNFMTHRGVDPLAMARAAVTDILQYGQGKRPIGASTITQQVAKNMLLGGEVSMARKAKEVLLALRIEQSLSKERILELYLNEIFLGLQSYGVAAAAQAYFNKPLNELNIQEAAFLAALPKAPNNYNPFRHPDAARARRDWVLERMADTHAITAEQAAAAKATQIVAAPFHRQEPLSGADYFAEAVRRHLVDKFGAEMTTQGGLSVRTSLDPVLQAAADRALHEGLLRYDQAKGYWRGPVKHIESSTALRVQWANWLALTPHPPGMLPGWRLGIVLETTETEARLGVLDRMPGAVAPSAHVLPMLIGDIGWARDKAGAAPHKIGDVLRVGDIVMTEFAPAAAVQGKNPARPDRLYLRQIPLVQGALVSLEPGTGRVLALSGGWSFEMSQFDRVTQANRQPGSSFKPFVYLTALEQGIPPSQRFLDAPFVVDQGTAGKWRPSNFELDFNGPVPLHVALEKSLNLVTVRVADKVGMEAVAQTAIAFHLVDSMPRVLPAALGAVETTVLREAGAYASLAAGGREVLPSLIDSVQDREGHTIWTAPGIACTGCTDSAHPPSLDDSRKQIADPPSVFQLNLMMQGVVTRGTGTAAGAGMGRQIAGKTGTSQDFQDAWFSGFTPDLVTTVWIGFDTPLTLGNNQTGGGLAAPVWHDFMTVALKNRPKLNFVPPPGVTVASYESGYGTITDAFKPGQEPGASAPVVGLGTGGNAGAAPADGSAPPPPSASAGVDSGMGGLY